MYRWLVPMCAFAAPLVQGMQPNMLFIHTDDQDIELGSLEYLPTVRKRLQREGFTFNNHYATVALCCPARVAMLRGQHAHNTNNTDVKLPGGSFKKFQASGEDANNLPHYLKRGGYRTEYIGKIMNGYAVDNYYPPPAGWDRFDGMVDPWMYTYNTAVFSVDGATPRYYEGSYLQDVVHAKAVDRVERLMADKRVTGRPWFLMVAPTAPHATFNVTGKWPPVPAARHAHLFQDVSAPRTPNFNPATNHKPSWVGQLPRMSRAVTERVDEMARARAQTLQSVDEMVAHLVELLEGRGELDSTTIVFSSDHGYHLGQHRVPCGKTLPYREDTHVPLLVRGPGVPAGLSTDIPSSHIDIVPTLLDFAGVDETEWPPWLDGRSLVPYFTAGTGGRSDRHQDVSSVETVNVEYWGDGLIEATGLPYAVYPANNSYKTARIVSRDYSYLYAVWCTGETELYDTGADPYELSPVRADASAGAARLASRLNGLMLLLKTCAGDSCRAPWSALHPDGSVRTLSDALDPALDAYYSSLPGVRFEACAGQYNAANEAPFFFGPGRGGARWPRQDARDYGVGSATPTADPIGWNGTLFGAVYEPLGVMEARARDLTPRELSYGLWVAEAEAEAVSPSGEVWDGQVQLAGAQ